MQKVWKQMTRLREVPDWLPDVLLETQDGECVFPSLLFTRLQELNLNSNRIQELPESVCKMKMLHMLHISG